MIPLPEQTRTAQRQPMDSSNIWYSSYPTATTAPTRSMPLSNTTHGQDKNLALSMEMAPQTRPTSSSASNFPNYTYQDPNGYQNDYAPSPSSLSNHHQHQHQHQAANLSTAQSTQLQAPLWTADQWSSAQYELASSQGRTGDLSATKDVKRGGF